MGKATYYEGTDGVHRLRYREWKHDTKKIELNKIIARYVKYLHKDPANMWALIMDGASALTSQALAAIGFRWFDIIVPETDVKVYRELLRSSFSMPINTSFDNYVHRTSNFCDPNVVFIDSMRCIEGSKGAGEFPLHTIIDVLNSNPNDELVLAITVPKRGSPLRGFESIEKKDLAYIKNAVTYCKYRIANIYHESYQRDYKHAAKMHFICMRLVKDDLIRRDMVKFDRNADGSLIGYDD